LQEFRHPDITGWIIIGAAMSLDAEVATKDEKLSSYSIVKTIW
jgi:hypothetical protein